ncbi:MAG: AI-2E family transporter [Candidatus Uhrbacteria bacterium]|nr:AI-2E family transporter [Candidatus Uhrbacteria bacterium]
MSPSIKTLHQKVSTVSITSGTILKFLGLLISIAVLYYLWDIVAILLVSLLFAALIDPFADWLHKRKLPRGLAVLVVYFVAFVLAVGALILIVPSMIDQLGQLLTDYAPYIDQISGNYISVDQLLTGDLFSQDFNTIFTTIHASGLADALPQLVDFTFSAFDGVLTALLIAILVFYMVVEEPAMSRGIEGITPPKYRHYIADMAPQVRNKIGAWLRARLLMMFIIFLITYAALAILQVPYALVLAFIAGLFELIPFVGPIFAAIPAIIIAWSVSFVQALMVLVFYFIVQQFEGDILTPKIMQKVGGLNPIVSVVALLVGLKVAGIIGAVLAIPFAMVIGVFINEWYSAKGDK